MQRIYTYLNFGTLPLIVYQTEDFWERIIIYHARFMLPTGEWKVLVNYNNTLCEGSPYHVNVYDPSAAKIIREYGLASADVEYMFHGKWWYVLSLIVMSTRTHANTRYLPPHFQISFCGRFGGTVVLVVGSNPAYICRCEICDRNKCVFHFIYMSLFV